MKREGQHGQRAQEERASRVSATQCGVRVRAGRGNSQATRGPWPLADKQREQQGFGQGTAAWERCLGKTSGCSGESGQ